MSGSHEVKQGEDLASIAAQHGFSAEKLWDENEALQQKRKRPVELKPGDTVQIPSMTKAVFNVEQETRTRFVMNIRRIDLELQLVANGKPRDGVPYRLSAEGQPDVDGTTTSEGVVKERVPFATEVALLVLFPGEPREEKIVVQVRHLDPENERSGVQQRLANLGLYTGEIDDDFGPRSKEAMASFLRSKGRDREGLQTDDDWLDALSSALDDAHGGQ